MARLEGRATPEGTRRFSEHPTGGGSTADGHFRDAPGKLRLSSVGLGTYIGRPDDATDRAVEETVRTVLSSHRVNVVDTAINYRYQRAERSIGRALALLVDQGKLARDEVFIASKVGYFAPDGETAIPPDEWVERELIGPGRLAPEDIVDGCHAMSPAYLRDQFDRSQRNLGLGTLDLLYLHNAPDAQLPVVGHDEFVRRLREAFAVLEEFRSQGRLEAYGLATWESLRVAPGDPGHFGIEEALEIAEEVGGPEHGLRYLQFPFSLAMPEAVRRATQPTGGPLRPVFACARRHHLGCFTSVPLVQGQLARRGPAWSPLTAAQSALQFARSAPGSLAALVGAKTPEHVAENLAVASHPPLSEVEFRRHLSELVPARH